MYGDWVGTEEYPDVLGVPGFQFSDQLIVFAYISEPYLKMVGLQLTGTQEGRYRKDVATNYNMHNIPVSVVKDAWESPTQTTGSHYQIKDTSSCFSGKVLLIQFEISRTLYNNV